jgi:hypothetical protein
MNRQIIIIALLIVVGAAGGLAYVKWSKAKAPADAGAPALSGPAHGAAGEWCGAHQIAEDDCPWCKPSLIASKGMCEEHGVPEALCAKCQPALIAGFKAVNDWCGGHGVPESQCQQCQAGDLPSDEKKE